MSIDIFDGVSYFNNIAWNMGIIHKVSVFEDYAFVSVSSVCSQLDMFFDISVWFALKKVRNML